MAQISAIDDYRSPKPQGVKNSGIERLLAEARLRLVETGTRNRLVHTPRAGKRTRSLAISGADADELFEILNQSTRALRFQATFPDDAQVEGITVGRKTGGAVLQTNLAEEPLAKRLLTIYRDARTAEEEQGINILFLAIGFLRWYEDDKSEVQREAPLVLVPVSLERDVRRSTFDLKVRDEDITTNQAIQERLRTDFGIALPNLPETEDWQPGEYFAAVREAIAVKPRWSVDANGLELGFYSFSKLLMIRDLEPTAWGDKPIIEHPLLRALLSEGFREESALLAADAKLDTVFKPADLIQVVDADSSQTIVIETVRAGRNVVVQGPPGTGKSQTITNIIASAVHDGKSVLFVAEKMAALDVVHARLQRAGLGPICLELHSRGANKRKVLAEVESTLAYNAAEPNAKSEEAHLAELRTVLNTVDERMHKQIGETGLTPFQAISSLISAAEAGIESYHPLLVHAAKWSASDYGSVIDAAKRLSEITATAGPCIDHPFYGVEATELQPTEIARLLAPLTALAEAATALAQWAETMADRLAITRDPSLDGCASILALLRTIDGIPATAVEFARVLPVQHILTILAAARAGLTLNDFRSELADIFLDAAFDLQVGPLRQSLTSGLSFFGRLGSDYRNASKTLGSLLKMPLPKKAAPRIALADRLIAFAKHQTEFLAEGEPMGAILPVYWRGSKTDFLALREAASVIAALVSHDLKPHIGSALELATKSLAREHIRTVTQLVERLNSAASIIVPALRVDLPKAFQAQSLDVIPLRSLAAKAHLWISETTRFDEWRRLSKADSRLRDLSGTVLADALSTGTIHPNVTAVLLRCTFAEAAWAKARAASPTLQDFYGPRHDELASEFRALEAKRRITTARLIQHRHAASMPRGNYGAMNIIRSQVKLKRGHMPIRKLFKTAGETLQRIKPVLLMSPISVAQFLPPGSVQFDLLVIDEASQVRPEDALGVVARAKQIVVVGDNKQLPPTSFFDRIVSDDDENDDDNEEAVAALGGAAKATELESILALCEARGLNSAMLRWHYRSRHPSLIEVSNAEFYKHLIMPPAPSADRLTEGLMLRRVAGAYDRGGKRINTIEADAIVVAVAHHARKSPQLSLGIVTFSTAQRDAINDRLDTIRQTDDALDAFLHEGKVEDVFVKNLENVQGDERDVILVSVGYGPRVAGARLDSMAFGPVSGEGGERRLNVLFTRARSRCEIFCSFASGDIDPDRAKGEGARILKRFLQYAETGILEERFSTSEDADSPFEETVATAIKGLGYKVDKQVGSAGFKIDLAVRHPDQPGRYMLAVECDGATYHSALWARERDRLRQEVLENLGWRFHRIWSTDWFYRRGEVLEKLKAALQDAAAATPGARQKQEGKVADPLSALVEPLHATPVAGRQIPAYRMTTCATPRGVEPHELHIEVMATITKTIVETEGPIHADEVARRVTALFGKSRTGSLISDASLRSLKILKVSSGLVEDQDFWMTPDQAKNPPVRDRSGAPASLQRADMLAPAEIRAAKQTVIQDNGMLRDEEMVVAITRLLGFKRAGPELKSSILAVLHK